MSKACKISIIVVVVVLLIAIASTVTWYMLTKQTISIYIDTHPEKTNYYIGEEH